LVNLATKPKKPIFGIPTVANDGKKYRSKFEADFVNKFLLPSGLSYEYEVKYPNQNIICDFYIRKYDIYIECVYHELTLSYSYMKQNYKIILDVPFEHKDRVKKLGAKWDTNAKTWYIVYTDHSLHQLFMYMRPCDLQYSILSNGKAITQEYDEKIYKKIIQKGIDIVLVNNKDINSYKDLTHLLIAKDNGIVIRKIAAIALDVEKEIFYEQT